MVYQVTMKHAAGKVSHDHIRNIIRRAHPEGEAIEFSYTSDGIQYSCGDSTATIDYDSEEITVTPGTPALNRISRLTAPFVLPAILIDRWNKKKNAKAMGVASIACVAGFDAEPTGANENIFSHISTDEWTTIRHNMGIGSDFDANELLDDVPFDPIAESRGGSVKTGFFDQVPDEHWLPPASWQGEIDEYEVEWLNYPPHSVQFFIRASGDENWMMSGAHRQGAPPAIDPEVYAEMLTAIIDNTELHYPMWFKMTMAILGPLDLFMLIAILMIMGSGG